MDDLRAKLKAKATRNNEFGFSLPFAFTTWIQALAAEQVLRCVGEGPPQSFMGWIVLKLRLWSACRKTGTLCRIAIEVADQFA
jgi:hypothetical protein